MKNRIGMALCDFALWVYTLGPKDEEDRENEREIIRWWKYFAGRGTRP